MSIEAGQQLLHYRLIEKIGEGGMGVVWKALDTTLEREVAIKLLPESLAGDTEGLARFEREAKLLAALNHPNIAAIHGLHEAPPAAAFLVMELVEGDELTARIARGAVPVEETLETARQIALALEAAHERGIVHRDLKPANVKRTSDGRIKVLDFGLAKAIGALCPFSPSADLSTSPTMTSAGTVAGTILGTAAYMSPEQAKGESVDRRADIWAFGVILFEMLTGRRLFAADSMSETLAAVLREEPDFEALPEEVPPHVRRVLARCLRKDPKRRYHHIADVRIDLAEPTAPAPASPRRSGWLRVAAGVLVGALATTGWWMLGPGSVRDTASVSDPTSVVRSQIVLPADLPIPLGSGVDSPPPKIALSPDGTRLLFIGTTDDVARLYLRDLASFEDPRMIAGSEGVQHATFSPDGETVAFVTRSQLKRVGIEGDDLRTLCDTSNALRVDWTADGWIWFGENESLVLRRIRETGGQPETVIRLIDQVFSQVLPDGRGALVSSRGSHVSVDYEEVGLLDLETLEVRPLIPSGYDPRYLDSGHLLFARGGNLLAVAFDAERGRVEGTPVTVVRGVAMDSFFGHVQVAVSQNGTVAYVPGGDRAIGRIVEVDRRTGEERSLPIEAALYGALDLDPQDRLLAVHVGGVNDYVWVYDLETGIGQKLPDSEGGGWPNFSTSGQRIAYTLFESGRSTLMLQEVGSREPPRAIFSHPTNLQVTSWSPDESLLAVSNFAEGRIAIVPIDDPDGVEWIAPDVGHFVFPDFSPDGRWLTYHSDESGLIQVWVRSYPEGDDVRLLWDGFAGEPIWCENCDEIFFRTPRGWMAAPSSLEAGLSWDAPQVAFTSKLLDTPGRSHDISSDGQRLFIVQSDRPVVRDRIRLVTNFDAELERVLPDP